MSARCTLLQKHRSTVAHCCFGHQEAMIAEVGTTVVLCQQCVGVVQYLSQLSAFDVRRDMHYRLGTIKCPAEAVRSSLPVGARSTSAVSDGHAVQCYISARNGICDCGYAIAPGDCSREVAALRPLDLPPNHTGLREVHAAEAAAVDCGCLHPPTLLGLTGRRLRQGGSCRCRLRRCAAICPTLLPCCSGCCSCSACCGVRCDVCRPTAGKPHRVMTSSPAHHHPRRQPRCRRCRRRGWRCVHHRPS